MMFPIEPGKDYAVITGDVIDSSSLTGPERKKLPALLHRISDELQQWRGDDWVTPLSVFGGDSWQILLRNPGDALRIGLFVRASVIASPLRIDTRFAIGIGGIDFVPEAGIEEADGEAFRLSGRLLAEEAAKPREIRLGTGDGERDAPWRPSLDLLDALVRNTWTEKRAHAIAGRLRGWTLQQTGEHASPPVSRQTVKRHLSEASEDEISLAVEQFERNFLR